MATKKRLSDLLRQEVQKLPETEDRTAIETTAVEVVEEDVPAEEKSTTEEEPDKNADSRSRAELEATIAELRSALEQTQKLEIAHQHEVSL